MKIVKPIVALVLTISPLAVLAQSEITTSEDSTYSIDTSEQPQRELTEREKEIYKDDRLPPVIPGEVVGDQVVISTAGPVVTNPQLPSVPTLPQVPTYQNQQLPAGVIVDDRRFERPIR